jgi:hypothetical protein
MQAHKQSAQAGVRQVGCFMRVPVLLVASLMRARNGFGRDY